MELKKIIIQDRLGYFLSGNYREWYEEYKENSENPLEYKPWVKEVLVKDMDKYEFIVLFSDGTLYGYSDEIGIIRLSDGEFDPAYEKDVFLRVQEKFG